MLSSIDAGIRMASTISPAGDHRTRSPRTLPPPPSITVWPPLGGAPAPPARSQRRPMTFARLTEIVSSSSTTVTVLSEMAVIAHSTNSKVSPLPMTTRSLSVASGIDSNQASLGVATGFSAILSLSVSSPSSSIEGLLAFAFVLTGNFQAIESTRSIGSSMLPSCVISTADCPPQMKSFPSIVEPSIHVSVSGLGATGLRSMRSTRRTSGSAKVCKPSANSSVTPSSSIPSSRPESTLPSICSSVIWTFDATISEVATAGWSGVSAGSLSTIGSRCTGCDSPPMAGITCVLITPQRATPTSKINAPTGSRIL